MRRLLVWLFWRHHTPGPWADRLYLFIVGAAIVFVYVRVVLLLLGAWPLNLPFGIDDWSPLLPGGDDTPAAVAGQAPATDVSPSARPSASASPTPSPSSTPSRSSKPSPTPSPTDVVDDVTPDGVDGGDGLDSSLVDDAGIVRDADTGVRFVLPPSYVRLSARSTESGTRWKASDSDCELWLAADRREPGADDGMGLWQRTVAALFDEERLPPATIAGRLPDARVSFVTSATQAGLAIAATDPRGARAYGDQRAALVCGTTLFEVAGRLAGGRPADVRRAVRRVCRSYEVLAAEGERLILRRTWFPEQRLRLTTPTTYAVKPYGGEPFATESSTVMARTIVERTSSEATGARGWLEVVPAEAGGAPPTKPTADEIFAFLERAEDTVRLSFAEDLDWGAFHGVERRGLVQAETTFMFARDGRTWRGRVWWWYANGRRTALALAAPASSFVWQQYVFAAIADSLQGVGR